MNQTFTLMPLCTNASKLPKVSTGQSFVVHLNWNFEGGDFWKGRMRRGEKESKLQLRVGQGQVLFLGGKKPYPFISHFLYDNVKTEKIKIRPHPLNFNPLPHIPPALSLCQGWCPPALAREITCSPYLTDVDFFQHCLITRISYLTLPGPELLLLGFPSRSQSLCRLSYTAQLNTEPAPT